MKKTHYLSQFIRVPHGLIGLLFIAIFWPLNWVLPDATLRTAYLFFPLWLGYILTVDALVYVRTGTSQLTRSWRDFLLLFLASAPAWWLFEWINGRTQNWEYLGRDNFTSLEYFLLCTLSFSTVMPAVFGTAQWVGSFKCTEYFARRPSWRPGPKFGVACFATGVVMLTVALLWPNLFYPFVWTSVFCILEPINARLGRSHFVNWLARGNWRPLISLAAGALICGFFWELWNYYSYPKWIYHTPGVEFLHIFEMPLLGYLGYLPFAFELYSLRSFLWPSASPL
jgi:hypothetical protein